MILYFGLFFGLFGLWIAQMALPKNKKMFNIAATVLVFAFIGLRDTSVGADTKVYSKLYYTNYDWGEKEFGYTLLTKFFNELGVSFNIFLIIISIFCGICFYVFIQKYSDNYIFSIILFVAIGNFTMFLTGLRQTIAISIIVLAIMAMLERKWYFFFPLVLFASIFHYSSIIFLPVYFLNRVKFSAKKIAIIAVVFWGILLVFYNPIFQFFSKYFPEQYAGDLQESSGKYGISFLVIAIEILIFIFCWLYCESFIEETNSKDVRIWSVLLIFQAIVVGFQLSARSSLQISRNAYYFDIAKLALITKAISKAYSEDKMIYKILIIAFAVLKFFISVPGGYSKIDNFQFFF